MSFVGVYMIIKVLYVHSYALRDLLIANKRLYKCKLGTLLFEKKVHELLWYIMKNCQVYFKKKSEIICRSNIKSYNYFTFEIVR